MSDGFTSRVIHLPQPFMLKELIEVWEFTYDATSDYICILDALGQAFASGESPAKRELFAGGDMEMFNLHWVMLCKITNMTRLKEVL